ncbi:MAG: cellulase family glycosylhydrolase, partial [Anaerolineae bacterium]|nr:cellulase family glycosylhydrolase [Anaerolineae bacterium]
MNPMKPMTKTRLSAGTNSRHLALWLPLVLALWLCALARPGSCQESPPLPRGHVFFETDFEGADALRGWTRAGKLAAGCQSVRALYFERSADATGANMLAEMTLPVERMRGYDVYLAAMIKAENVSETPAQFHGIKFMTLAVQGTDKSYAGAPLGLGTFDWKPVVFHVQVPQDATAFSLLVGLQGVSGKAWFDNIQVTVRKPPRVLEPRTAGPAHKGHDLPRLRGMQVSPTISENDLRALGREWNANVVRLQLIRRGEQAKGDLLDLAAYDLWLEGELEKLDATLRLCEKYGLMAVVDLHSPPGGGRTPSGYIGTSGGLFTNAACQKKFIKTWERIARRCKHARAVWGYDLANEPLPPRNIEPGLLFEGAILTPETTLREENAGLDDWEELAARAARAVRTIDPDRAIIFEPPLGYSPRGLRNFQPIAVPNVVYSVHMYEPGVFTHQGVNELRKREPWVKKY